MKKASDFLAWLIAAMLIIASGYFAFPASAAQSTVQQRCDAILQYANVVYDLRADGVSREEAIQMEQVESAKTGEGYNSLYRQIIDYAYKDTMKDKDMRLAVLRSTCAKSLK